MLTNNWYRINKRRYWGLVEELEIVSPVMVCTHLRPSRTIVGDHFHLDKDGTLWLFIKYRWDGCSGITFDRKKGRSRLPSAVHDCLYYILENYEDVGFTRADADRVFLITGLQQQMVIPRIYTYHLGVRAFGGVWLYFGKRTWG